MANFNYLDFFKTPSGNDTKLFIKDINNTIVWSLSPFKIKSSLVQNNNIRINFTNGDFILIDFNNVYESKYALPGLQTAINSLINKVPFVIDKDVELYVHNLKGDLRVDGNIYLNGLTFSSEGNNFNLWGNILPGLNNTFNLGSPDYQWHSLYVGTSSIYLGGMTLSAIDDTLLLYNLNVSGDITSDLKPSINGIYNLGSNESQWNNLYASSSIYLNGVTLSAYNDTLFLDNLSFTGDILLNNTTSVLSYFSATSSTALQIPDVGQNVILSVPSKMSWTPMQSLLIYANLIDNYMVDDYVEGDSSAYFIASVDSYDRTTGTLSVVVDYSNGYGITISGTSSSIVPTYSLWYINITGRNGQDGASSSNSGLSYFNPASFSRISTTYSLVMSDSRIYMDGGYSLKFTNYYEGITQSSRQLIRAWDKSGPLDLDNNTDYERAQISFDLEDTDKSSISLHSFDWTNYPVSTDYELKLYNGEISSLINGVPTGSVINDTTLKGTTNFQQTVEILGLTSYSPSVSPSTITYDFSKSGIWYQNDLTENYVASFINVPETDNRVITSTIIISQTASAYIPNNVTINGSEYLPIYWSGGSLPSGTPDAIDLVGFSFIRTGNNITILGQLSTFNTV